MVGGVAAGLAGSSMCRVWWASSSMNTVSAVDMKGSMRLRSPDKPKSVTPVEHGSDPCPALGPREASLTQPQTAEAMISVRHGFVPR